MSTISVLVKGTARENSDAIDEARAESSCSMGVGCGTSGVCWAKAHNAPEMCARTTGAADFNAMAAKCRKAWADVPNASDWVEEVRGRGEGQA